MTSGEVSDQKVRANAETRCEICGLKEWRKKTCACAADYWGNRLQKTEAPCALYDSHPSVVRHGSDREHIYARGC